MDGSYEELVDQLSSDLRGSSSRTIRALEIQDNIHEPRLSIYLPALTESDDLEVRTAALRTIGRSGCRDLVSLLLQGINDNEPRVVSASCVGLGALGRDQDVCLLEDAAWHYDWHVRFVSVMALEAIASHEAVEALTRLAVSGKSAESFRAIRAIADLGAALPEALLLTWIRSSSGNMLGAAFYAAGKNSVEASGQAIVERLLSDSDAELRGSDRSFSWMYKDVFPVHWTELSRSGEENRIEGAEALGRLQCEAASDVIAEALGRTAHSVWQARCLRALAAVNAELGCETANALVAESVDPLLVVPAIEVLSVLGAEYEGTLRTLVERDDRHVKVAALLAMHRNELGVDDVLRTWGHSSNPECRAALAEFYAAAGTAELDWIRSALSDESEDVRYWATTCLESAGEDEVDSFLLPVLSCDPSSSVRSRAARVVGAHGGPEAIGAIAQHIIRDADASMFDYRALREARLRHGFAQTD